MKIHEFTRGGFIFEQDVPSLSLGCKRYRPLAPKLAPTDDFDLKSFIRPESSHLEEKRDSLHQTMTGETHLGGTRWNPTQEQIGILEMLYRGGMRTPNAQQIEQITAQLGKYGKIEGKNVFYWFQNHKARERQKQKRSSLGLNHSPRTPPPSASFTNSPFVAFDPWGEQSACKRKWPTYGSLGEENSSCGREEGDGTLELFPLHPELGR
ncbi:unnamed protein product [Cuscuta epithymum]|uniref:Homeobox domain-containing protein n=1 Tax=Cuscuta epithymum TaxID=186058 RepID=A0AAV0CIM7_9ASTE|nr:unnamed protein product [Cuscuta epithymum]CAH9131911.1 unnamed protein product [Cuscuta epithymum]